MSDRDEFKPKDNLPALPRENHDRWLAKCREQIAMAKAGTGDDRSRKPDPLREAC